MIKLLIADDHKVLLDGFLSIFEKVENIQVMGTANNGQQVLDFLKDQEVDIVLMDINMPVLNGVETCKKITKKFAAVKVIALSMYRQVSYIKRMKQNGAQGYLLKDDSSDTMIEAIQKVHEGEEYYSSQLKDILLNSVFQEKASKSTNVTKREKEVLEHIAKGLTNAEIGSKLFLSEHTIISHRKNLLSKFNAKNTADLVRIAMEKGII